MSILSDSRNLNPARSDNLNMRVLPSFSLTCGPLLPSRATSSPIFMRKPIVDRTCLPLATEEEKGAGLMGVLHDLERQALALGCIELDITGRAAEDEILSRQVTQITELREAHPNSGALRAIQWLAIKIRERQLIHALKAKRLGLCDLQVFDSGLVALPDGRCGELKLEKGGAIFVNKSGGDQKIFIANSATEYSFLSLIPKDFNGEFYFGGKKYLLLKRGQSVVTVLDFESRRHFKFYNNEGKLSLRETDFQQSAFGKIFEWWGKYFYVDETELLEAYCFSQNDRTVFWIPGIGALVGESGQVKCLETDAVTAVQDESGATVFIWNSQILKPTEETNIYSNPENPGTKYLYIETESGWRTFLSFAGDPQIQRNLGFTVLQDQANGSCYVILDAGYRISENLIKIAREKNWTLYSNEGEPINPDIVVRSDSLGHISFCVAAEELKKKDQESNVLVIHKNGTTENLCLSHPQFQKAWARGDSYAVINGLFFEFYLNGEEGQFFFRQISLGQISADVLTPELSPASCDNFYYRSGDASIFKRVGTRDQDFDKVSYEIKEGRLCPAKTMKAFDHEWCVHANFERDGDFFYLVSSHASFSDVPAISLLRKRCGYEKMEMVREGNFRFVDATGKIRHLFVGGAHVWDVSQISEEGITTLPHLGTGQEMRPSSFMAFKRQGEEVVPASRDDLRESLKLDQSTGFYQDDNGHVAGTQRSPLNGREKIELKNRFVAYKYPAAFMIGAAIYTGFDAQEFVIEENGHSLSVILPTPDSALVRSAREMGYYIPEENDLPLLYRYLRENLDDEDLHGCQQLTFVPGQSFRKSKAEYVFNSREMRFFATKIQNGGEWLQTISVWTLVHELAGHGHQHDRQELEPLVLAMMLDGVTMEYGETDIYEFHAVLAEYFYCFPEFVHIFPNCFAVFYEMIQKRKRKLVSAPSL